MELMACMAMVMAHIKICSLCGYGGDGDGDGHLDR